MTAPTWSAQVLLSMLPCTRNIINVICDFINIITIITAIVQITSKLSYAKYWGSLKVKYVVFRFLGPRGPFLPYNVTLEEAYLGCEEDTPINSDWGLWCCILPVIPQGAHRKPQGPKEHLKNSVRWASQNLISVYILVSHTSSTGCLPGSFHLNGGTTASSLLAGKWVILST